MDNTDSNFKFQWSMKLENGEIYVVRSNDFALLTADIDLVKIRIKNKIDKEFSEDTKQGVMSGEIDEHGDFEAEMENHSFCKVHSVEMKKRTGKTGDFYSHSRGTYPNLEWCSGNGFPTKQ